MGSGFTLFLTLHVEDWLETIWVYAMICTCLHVIGFVCSRKNLSSAGIISQSWSCPYWSLCHRSMGLKHLTYLMYLISKADHLSTLRKGERCYFVC